MQSMKFMPTQGSAHSVYDSTGDDHDGGPAAGVAYGFDPSGGEPCYQFGELWVRAPLDSQLMCGRVALAFSCDSSLRRSTLEISRIEARCLNCNGWYARSDLIEWHACRIPKCPTGRPGRDCGEAMQIENRAAL